ncbi:hypothetical protein COCON_G00070390 [Conger conger]|uniref:Uncharacterized protein n=1 Tax=Conger conger TaxID=82655 RepID=A0A9Q1DT56_CONCO|nr:hypothetical protein COCON_G00070390 [Conger conger]
MGGRFSWIKSVDEDRTYVANATGSTLVSVGTKTVMKRDKCVRYLRIPPDKHAQILAEGAIYVTVYVEQKGSSDERLNISQNFYIPSDRSFIVTADHNIMLQLYGANIWVDEGGNDHRK